MSDSTPADPDETLYPESPRAAPYETVPPPYSADLKLALEELGKQDVGAKRTRP